MPIIYGNLVNDETGETILSVSTLSLSKDGGAMKLEQGHRDGSGPRDREAGKGKERRVRGL